MDEYKFPTEVVDLPSKGYFYSEDNPLSSGKIELKYMTAREEDILTSANLIKSGLVLDKLLEALVMDKKVNLDDILIGDKNGLIVASRILGYGKEYAFEYIDDTSGQTKTHTVDLTSIKDKELDFSKFAKGVNEFSFELPTTKRTITFKLLTQKDEREIDTELKAMSKLSEGASVKSELTTRFKKLILSIDGNSDRNAVINFVDREFLSRDSLEFRKHLVDITPDLDMSVTIKDDSGEEREVMVPVTIDFFWPTI